MTDQQTRDEQRKHTPTPWLHQGYMVAVHDGAFSRMVARCDTGGVGWKQAEDNAAFIVEACNSHASLLAVVSAAREALYALERCVPAIYGELINGASPVSHRELDAARNKLKAAIAALPAAGVEKGE